MFENTESCGLLLVCCTAVFLLWVGRGRAALPGIGDWVLNFLAGYLMQLVVAVTVFVHCSAG